MNNETRIVDNPDGSQTVTKPDDAHSGGWEAHIPAESSEKTIDLSAAQPLPEGQEIVTVVLRGTGTQLVDETLEGFTARFSAFMNEKHERGDLFRFTTFYSWQATVDKITHMHVIRAPGAWTLDGCQDVQAINVDFIKTKPIEITTGPPKIVAPGFPGPLHGPGKRR